MVPYIEIGLFLLAAIAALGFAANKQAMHRLLLGGMVMLTAVAGPVSAQPTPEALMQANGHEFVRLCEVEDNAELCNMTLRLAEQSLGLGGLVTLDPGVELACLPEGKLPPDVLSKVLSWLKAQPTALEQKSLDAVGAALKALYPCP